MKIFLVLILSIYLTSCKLNKIVNHHGVHNLEAKSDNLSINVTNVNDITKLLGPPSTTSYFNNEVLIYLERKTSNSKLLKLGKKKLIANNVLLLEINNRGMLIKKEFLNQDDLNKINFSKKTTSVNAMNESFIYRALYGIRTKIDDPLGKKRGSLGR